jgi:hypothetical protein
VSLKNVIFGDGTDSTDVSMGIMGLSFGENYNLEYPSFVDELADQNVTATRAFGIALGTKSEPTNSGLVTFGGVDSKKFSGTLHTAQILGPQNGENLYRYWVQLDSISMKGKKYSGSSFPVFFDTGATLSYFPSAMVQQLAGDLSGKRDSASGLYIVPCGQSGTIDFAFGSATIQVPLSEFIWDVGNNQCVLGADVGTGGSYILGDSFLRSVYAVFDITSQAIHFAPYVNCGTNLQAIPVGMNAAAKIQGECTAPKPNAANGRISGPIAGAGIAAGSVMAVMALL